MHYLQFPSPQTQYSATYICPLWWIIWWGSKWYNKTCTRQTDATAAWEMRATVSCIMWSSQRGEVVCPDPCQQVPTYWAPTVIIIIIFVFYLQDWPRRFPGVMLMPLTELCLMYFYIPDAQTERRKERKMSGEERNTRKPCTRHKTATMIAYRSPLPNNRRRRHGQGTFANKHSMPLPLSSKKTLSSQVTLLNKNIMKEPTAIQASDSFKNFVTDGAVCTLYNAKSAECPRPSANFSHRFIQFWTKMKRT